MIIMIKATGVYESINKQNMSCMGPLKKGSRIKALI